MATLKKVTALDPIKLPDFGEHLRGETTEWLDNDTRQFINGLRLNPYLAGQTVVLAGAAGGIGKKTAIICAEAGARVFALDVVKNVADIYAQDPQIVGVRVDLTNENKTRAAIEKIGDAYGIQKLGLIAGIYGPRPKDGDPRAKSMRKFIEINALAHDTVANAASRYMSSNDNADLDPAAFWVISRQTLKPNHHVYGPSKTAEEGVFHAFAINQEEAFAKGITSVRHIAYYPDNLPDTGIWGATKAEQEVNFAASLGKRGVTKDEFLANPNPIRRVITSWGVAANIVKDLHPVCRIGHGSQSDLSGGFIIRV